MTTRTNDMFTKGYIENKTSGTERVMTL